MLLPLALGCEERANTAVRCGLEILAEGIRQRLPMQANELRLVVEQIERAGAPAMCSQITDWAFGAKCGVFGASGSSTAANAGALDSSPPASDSAPTPYPVLSRKSRRVVTLLMSKPSVRTCN